MTNEFKNLEIQASAWYKLYIKSFEIIVTDYEREHFVDKWHENIPWDACPVKTAKECTQAILEYRKGKSNNEK